MAAVSETIVREYFELNGFLVRQQRKHIARSQREGDDADFVVLNPRPQPGEGELPFILATEDLPRLQRAVVVVKGWHTETFSPTRLTQMPEIFRFASPGALRQGLRLLGGDDGILKVLVVPSLPQNEAARRQSIEVMRANGVDAALSFQTILTGLIAGVEVNRDYQKSDLLQVLRILKNYEFFREPQLELFKVRRPRRAAPTGE